jgi:dTDP-4-amino-4,6-dideoxygalactose transaminase
MARRVSVYPSLNPRALRRPRNAALPFPLEEPGCRIYLKARQGLWRGLQGLGIGDGDEVLAPAYHHGSEIETVVRTGARCVFYDSKSSYEPEDAELETLLTSRTRGLYVIHTLGFAQDAARWRRWCDERGLLLIEDGAQAWLGSRNGRPLGTDADLALFCLYKAVAVPDGGAVIARSIAGPPPHDQAPGIRGAARLIANWLAQRSSLATAVVLGRHHGHEPEERPEVDFALAAVDERPTRATQALLPRVLAGVRERRWANFARLARELAGLRSPAFAHLPAGSSPLAFPIEVDDKRRVVAWLAEHGVASTQMWMVPHPLMDPNAHPGAAALRARLVGLPVHHELRRADLEQILVAVRRAIG